MAATPVIDGWFTTGPEPTLLGTTCVECSTVYFPRNESFCRNPRCNSTELRETPLSRRGTVWSYTDAQYQPPAPYIPNGEHTPFAIAAVELPEGMVVVGQVADGYGVADMTVGSDVELVVETLYTTDEGEEKLVWRWRPTEAEEASA